MSFNKIYTYEKRLEEATRVINKYTDRIPIIAEVDKNTKEIVLDKKKYLVPCDLSLSQFIFVIRKRLKVSPEQSVFIFFNNYLPASSELMGDVYNKYKSDDNFLYATVSLESTFG
jgi:GABA(A) receptor-associated protein